MASNAGKKGKKQKAKAVSLQDFLANDAEAVKAGFSIVTTKKKDWATEVEAEGGYDDSMDINIKPGEQYVLPSGPMGPNIDMSKVPTSPPFTAFLGNLAYDIEKEDIEEFFKSLRVSTIRIPRAAEGQARVRGFGYVEFEDRQSLLDALAMNEKHLKSGRVKIDVADNQGDGYDPRRRDNKDRGFPSGPDRTGGDWRAASRDDSSSARPERSYRDGDREGSRFSGRSERDYGDRGFRSGSGGGPAFGDRGPPGEREAGGERTAFTNFRSSSNRTFGDRYNNESSERDSYDRGGRGGGRRDFGGGGFRSEGGSDYGSRFGRSGGSGGGFDRGERGGGQYGESQAGSEDGPSERPRLNLQPRTKPREDISVDEVHREAPESRERIADVPTERPKLVLQPRTKPVEEAGAVANAAVSRPSIFGGAKPVDTAAREREIEQRLAKERAEPVSMRSVSDIRIRESAAGRYDGDERDSPHEDHTSNREPVGETTLAGVPPRKPRTSTSSQGGRSPHTSGSARHSSTSETEDDKPRLPAPAAASKQQQPTSPRREEVVVVPAPPPKENAWAKRSATVQQQPAPAAAVINDSQSNANHETEDRHSDAPNSHRSNSVGSTGSDSEQRVAPHIKNAIHVGK